MSCHVTGRTSFSSCATVQQHDCWQPISVKSDLDGEGLIQFEMFFTHVQVQNLFFSTDTEWYSEESEHFSMCNPVFHLTLWPKLNCCCCCLWAFAFDLMCLWYSAHIKNQQIIEGFITSLSNNMIILFYSVYSQCINHKNTNKTITQIAEERNAVECEKQNAPSSDKI